MTKHHRFRNMDWRDKVFYTIVYILLFVSFVITLYPMLFVLSASFSDPVAVSTGKMILFPVNPSLEGYKRIFTDDEIYIGYANTIFYTVVGTFFNLAVTLPCAYGLSRKDLKGRGIIMGIFVFTMYFSGGLIPSYLNVESLGLVNTRWVLLILGLVSTYNMIVCRTYFESSIPWELHEAAVIDGCSDFRIFRSIVMPLSKPITVVMMLYYGVGHWNEYFSAMIYLRDRNLYPLQLFLREILIQSKISASMMETADVETAYALAKQQDQANMLKYGVIVVSTVPMLVLYPFVQKYFTQGIMIGSLKG